MAHSHNHTSSNKAGGKKSKTALGAFALSVLAHGAVLLAVGGYVIFEGVIPKSPFLSTEGAVEATDSEVLPPLEEPMDSPSLPPSTSEMAVSQPSPASGEATSSDILVSTGLNSSFSLPPAVGLPTANPKLGFGSGTSGSGTGTGGPKGNVVRTLFGSSPTARRIAFLVDYSGSMEGALRTAMEKRLEESLKSLPSGTQMLIIPWAGGAWLYNQKAPEIQGKWKKAGDYDDFQLTAGSKLEPPKWVTITPGTIKELMAGVKAQVSWPGGTDWRSPIHYAMQASPPPDLITLMTDGQIPQENIKKKFSQIRTEIDKTREPPVINCIWIKNSLFSSNALKRLAEEYKGELMEIDQQGVLK
jgi:hypothetical protein